MFDFADGEEEKSYSPVVSNSRSVRWSDLPNDRKFKLFDDNYGDFLKFLELNADRMDASELPYHNEVRANLEKFETMPEFDLYKKSKAVDDDKQRKKIQKKKEIKSEKKSKRDKLRKQLKSFKEIQQTKRREKPVFEEPSASLFDFSQKKVERKFPPNQTRISISKKNEKEIKKQATKAAAASLRQAHAARKAAARSRRLKSRAAKAGKIVTESYVFNEDMGSDEEEKGYEIVDPNTISIKFTGGPVTEAELIIMCVSGVPQSIIDTVLWNRGTNVPLSVVDSIMTDYRTLENKMDDDDIHTESYVFEPVGEDELREMVYNDMKIEDIINKMNRRGHAIEFVTAKDIDEVMDNMIKTESFADAFKSVQHLFGGIGSIINLADMKTGLAKMGLWVISNDIIPICGSFTIFVFQLTRSRGYVDMIAATLQFLMVVSHTDKGRELYEMACLFIGEHFDELSDFDYGETVIVSPTVRTESLDFSGKLPLSERVADFGRMATQSLSSNLVQSLRNMILVLTSKHFFRKDIALNVYQWLGKPKEMNYLELMHHCFDNIVTMLKFGESIYNGVPLTRALFSSDPIGEMLLEIKELLFYSDKLYTGLPTPGFLHRSLFYSKCDTYVKGIEYYAKYLGAFHPQRKPCMDACLSLRNHMSIIDSETLGKKRPFPMGAILCGDPSIGKSVLTDFVCYTFMKAKGIEYSSDMVFTHIKNDNFSYEGYLPHSHQIIKFSEMANQNDNIVKKMGDPVMVEINSLLDTQPYPVPCAFGNKGRVFAQPAMIIGDTNRKDLQLDDTMSNPAALRRRFLFIEPFVKEEFRKSDGMVGMDFKKSFKAGGNLMDRWTFDVWREEPTGIKKTIKEYYGHRIDIKELGSILLRVFREHIEKEEKFSKIDNSEYEKCFDKYVIEVEECEVDGVHLSGAIKPYTCDDDIKCELFTESLEIKDESEISEENMSESYKEMILPDEEYVRDPKKDGHSWWNLSSILVHESARLGGRTVRTFTGSATSTKNFILFSFQSLFWQLYLCMTYITKGDTRLYDTGRINNYGFYWMLNLIRNGWIFSLLSSKLGFRILVFLFNWHGVPKKIAMYARLPFALVISLTWWGFMTTMIFTASWFSFVSVWNRLGLPNLLVKFKIKGDNKRSRSIKKAWQRWWGFWGLKYNPALSSWWYSIESFFAIFLFIYGFFNMAKYFYRKVRVLEVELRKKEGAEVQSEATTFVNVSPADVALNEKEDFFHCQKSYARVPNKINSVWNTIIKTTSPPYHKGPPLELENAIGGNIRVAMVAVPVGDDVKNVVTHVLGIKDQFGIINTHSLGSKKGVKIKVSTTGGIGDLCKAYIVTTLDDLNSFDLGNDVTVVQFSGLRFKNILNHVTDHLDFTKGITHNGILMKSRVRPAFRESEEKEGLTIGDDLVGSIYLHNFWQMSFAEHRKGLCGIPLIVESTVGSAIVGIHVAGHTSSSIAYCTPIIRDDIDRGIANILSKSPFEKITSQSALFPMVEMTAPTAKSPFVYEVLHGIEYYGRYPGDVLMHNKSKVKHSFMSDRIGDLFYKYLDFIPTEKFMPPYLKPFKVNGKYFSLYNESLKKMCVEKKSLDPKICMRIRKDFSDRLIAGLKESGLTELNPLDITTAINGAAHDAYLRRMNCSTSAGFGLPGVKGRYLEIVEEKYCEIVRELTAAERKTLDDVLEALMAGESVNFVYKALGKDEPRNVKKAMVGGTRIFCVSPLLSIILNRMFLAPFYTLMVEHNDLFCTSVGINMHMGADEFINDLNDFSPLFMEGDYSSYDQAMPFDIGQVANGVIVDVLSAFGYKPGAIDVVRGLLAENLFPIIFMNNDMFCAPGYQPSGKYATAEDNSLKGVLLLMYVWYSIEELKDKNFFDYVKVKTYGDDVLVTVHPSVQHLFNNKVYQAKCAELFGMKYTTAGKSDEVAPFLSMSEVTFLKRSFRKSEVVGRYVAPLDLNSLYRSLDWYIPSKQVTLECQMIDTVNSCLWELFFHLDRRRFDGMRGELFDMLLEQFGVPKEELNLRLVGWDELVAKLT